MEEQALCSLGESEDSAAPPDYMANEAEELAQVVQMAEVATFVRAHPGGVSSLSKKMEQKT